MTLMFFLFGVCLAKTTFCIQNSAAIQALDILKLWKSETRGKFQPLVYWLESKQLNYAALDYLKLCYDSFQTDFQSWSKPDYDLFDFSNEHNLVKKIRRNIKSHFNSGFTNMEKQLLFYTAQVIAVTRNLNHQGTCPAQTCTILSTLINSKLKWMLKNKNNFARIASRPYLQLDEVTRNFFEFFHSSNCILQLQNKLYSMNDDSLNVIIEHLTMDPFVVTGLKNVVNSIETLKKEFHLFNPEQVVLFYVRFSEYKEPILINVDDPDLTKTFTVLQPLLLLAELCKVKSSHASIMDHVEDVFSNSDLKFFTELIGKIEVTNLDIIPSVVKKYLESKKQKVSDYK